MARMWDCLKMIEKVEVSINLSCRVFHYHRATAIELLFRPRALRQLHINTVSPSFHIQRELNDPP